MVGGLKSYNTITHICCVCVQSGLEWGAGGQIAIQTPANAGKCVRARTQRTQIVSWANGHRFYIARTNCVSRRAPFVRPNFSIFNRDSAANEYRIFDILVWLAISRYCMQQTIRRLESTRVALDGVRRSVRLSVYILCNCEQ